MSNGHISQKEGALLMLFKACGKVRTLSKRALIIPYLEAPKCLFMVMKGSLSVALSNAECDGVVCIHHLKPGDIFGEQGLFDSVPMHLATASLTARCDVELWFVTHDDLRRAARLAPSINNELSTHINNRLGETTAKLLQLVFENIEQRCYHSLIEITRLPDALTHPEGMQISVTRIELAQMIGANRESAGRALRALHEKGLVEASGRRIVIFGIRHGEKMPQRQSEKAECV